MNVLFYNYFECCPEGGGTERATEVLSNALVRNFGYKTFCIYQVKYDERFRRAVFTASHHLPSPSAKAVADIIRRDKIDVIVNQQCYRHSRMLRKAITLSGCPCRLVFAYHSKPFGGEQSYYDKDKFRDYVRREPLLKRIVKVSLFHVYKFVKLKLEHLWFRQSSEYSDKVVLLSERFIPAWRDAAESSRDNVCGIPNSLSFPEDAVDADTVLNEKGRKVLIVSRLARYPKRVMLALQIWKILEQDPRLDGWSLDILGTGIDEEELKKYAAENLKRVRFLGACAPFEHYCKASLFFMTSSYEGWGMTLVEAAQTGCVSLAFDTYESLHDIISDGVNGFIIPEGDIKGYAEKAAMLMLDADLRRTMARNAIDKAKRFAPARVAAMWKDVLCESTEDASPYGGNKSK